ncbi:ATP-grasp domain-containing protein [Planomonospora sp. ID67723]|uniref:ATP-grasp domain-containing protein n=1 Tax=Planomonospora sp. ID67723 TaxID=2738134 RepID=UPI0018C365DA|nr:ATP-grasp domain-containing protein [Planomonospora sp. ID67723]
MTVGFLFCADPLLTRRVDPHFEPEALAVRDRGGRLALIDHDALVAGRAGEAVARVPDGFGPVWYRGWMLRSAQYAALEKALRAKGCRLLTGAGGYRRAHELPGWLHCFWELTPRTAVVPMAPGERAPRGQRLARLAGGLGETGFVVKDYVKSRKHEWLQACYAPDLDTLERVVARFVELQGEDLTGGLVIRQFEHFTGAQVRVWWVDGEAVFAGPHPDGPDDVVEQPEIVDDVREAVQNLGIRFVTTDLARRADGAWRVIEVGDGQVSDWPSAADPGVLADALLVAKGYGFRVSKYDPALRDEQGVFLGDDWTAISEVGEVFGGVVLTRERYEAVEDAYLQAVALLAGESGVERLTVRQPEGAALPEGKNLALEEALEVVRAMLREGTWCRLEDGNRFHVYAGYDYYLHVASSEPCGEAVGRIHRLGLFVEDEPAWGP